MPAINPEARKLHEQIDAAKAEKAAKAREELRPSKMKMPMTIKLKSFRGEPICGGAGLYDNDIPGGRKLLPGEVVCVDLASPWVQTLVQKWCEPTMEAITRPIVFPSKRHARACAGRPIANMTSEQQSRLIEDVRQEAKELQAEYLQVSEDHLAPEDKRMPEGVQQAILSKKVSEVVGRPPRAAEPEKKPGGRTKLEM